MTGTPRDRAWVAALALARTRDAFTAADVASMADLDGADRGVAAGVLDVMATYGYLERTPGGDAWRAGRSVPVSSADPAGFDGAFTHLSAPVTRWTFAPDPVREWVESRLEGRVLNLFAGGTRLRHDGEVVRNDLDTGIDAEHHVDAADAAEHFDAGSFDTVVLDPPPSVWRGADGALARIRNGVAELVPVGGRTITFGRSSSGMGSARGFERTELCLIEHPGTFDDTIAVVERRVRGGAATRQL